MKWTNNNITSNALTSRTCRLSLCAKTRSGVSFFINDERLVSWTCDPVEGTSYISDDGTLTIGANSAGYVIGYLRVAETGSLTSALTFGSERYNTGSGYSVVTGSTIGGSVTGGGAYIPNELVTLTAVPDPGYYFTAGLWLV